MFNNKEVGFLQSRQNINKRHRNNSYEDDLNNLFNKKFRFRFNDEWKLAENDSWFASAPWRVKELDTLKSRLNFHKSQLNDFNIEEWSCHTRRRNPAGEVCWKIKCLINPEFLTQAWTKFYECAYTFNIIPQEAVQDKKIVSVHLCEAPGAFITSLNHYLRTHYKDMDWQWVATTLNPYYEGNSLSNMISDDRFMYHTLDNWDFGCDNTGNLMNWDNSQAIIKKATALGKVMLVTADGSIDCLQKPDAQEEVTSPLHYCEIVTALQCLSKGGTFVFKLFTIFEHSTVNLLYLVNHLFHEVHIYKPVTSRQGNSEVYAICLDFRGPEYLEPYIDNLKHGYGTEIYSTKSLFPLESIPDDFISQVKECAYYFCTIQCQVINNNLHAYLMQSTMTNQVDVKRIRTIVATEFIRVYDLRPLTFDLEILKGSLHDDHKINTNPRYHRGSYTERQLYKTMNVKEKLKYLNTFLQNAILTNHSIFLDEKVRWCELYSESLDIRTHFTHGKPLERIYSSKFIFVPIFKLYHQILDEPEFNKIIVDIEQNLSEETDTIEQCQTVNLPLCESQEKYFVYEKKCFQTLMKAINELSVGESLAIHNFNTLTHFNVSILFILCMKCFEKTGFASSCIILSNLMDKRKDIFDNVETALSDVTDTRDVLSVLPVQTIYNEQFFNNIVFYNNTFYRNKCQQHLKAIEKTV